MFELLYILDTVNYCAIHRVLAGIGRQLTTFNSEAQVLIGGKKDTMGHLVRPFRGTIAGASLCQWLLLYCYQLSILYIYIRVTDHAVRSCLDLK